MKHLSYILLTALVLTACTASKKSSITNSVSADTLLQQAVAQKQEASARLSFLKEKDSAVGLPAKAVSDEIAAKDTEVPRTKDGTAVPRHFSKKQNGLEAWVTIKADGNISYGANADSLTLIIRNLQQWYDSVSHVKATYDTTNTYQSSQKTISSETYTVKVRSFWASNWWWIVAAVVLGVVAFIIKTWGPR